MRGEKEKELDKLKRELQKFIDDTAIDAKDMAGHAIAANSLMGCVHGLGVLMTLWEVEKIVQGRKVVIRRDFIKAQKKIIEKEIEQAQESTNGNNHDTYIR